MFAVALPLPAGAAGTGLTSAEWVLDPRTWQLAPRTLCRGDICFWSPGPRRGGSLPSIATLGAGTSTKVTLGAPAADHPCPLGPLPRPGSPWSMLATEESNRKFAFNGNRCPPRPGRPRGRGAGWNTGRCALG